jgi:hypothetical protein
LREAITIKKEGKYRCFDPVLWIDPLDRLWFIWNVMPSEACMAVICEDPDADELVWSEEFQIGRGIMMNKPLVLTSGEWLFPIALWQLDIYSEFRKSELCDDDVAASYVYKTSDNGKTFTCIGGADVKNRTFDEHMLYEMDNGVLRMLVRLKNGIADTYSYDRGKTWSRGQTTSLGGPSSRFFIKKLKSGRKKITVTWKKRTKYTTGYQIQYGTKKSYKNARKVKIKGFRKTQKVIKRLKSGKKYYVRIRTYRTYKGKTYYSAWSKTKTVKVR